MLITLARFEFWGALPPTVRGDAAGSNRREASIFRCENGWWATAYIRRRFSRSCVACTSIVVDAIVMGWVQKVPNLFSERMHDGETCQVEVSVLDLN